MKTILFIASILALIACQEAKNHGAQIAGDADKKHEIRLFSEEALFEQDTVIDTISDSDRRFKNWKEEALCGCFLTDSGTHYIYDAIHGAVIDSIKNDYANEILYAFLVLEQNGKWFRILNGEPLVEKPSWLYVNKPFLGVYGANYASKVEFYLKPSIESEVVYAYKDTELDTMKVLKCIENWMFVEFEMQDSTYNAWVPDTSVCGNPYTHCC